jgi:hypothetical protein
VHGLPLKLPGRFELKLTAPDGVLAVPAAVSVTVAVHVVACPTFTRPGEQLNFVEVGCPTTVTVVMALLVAWVASPP